MKLQGNYACHVETSKVQVHISVCYLVRFHINNSLSHRRLLGIRRSTPQSFQRLLTSPQDWLAWHCRHLNAHSPGSAQLAALCTNIFFTEIWQWDWIELNFFFLHFSQFITFGFACTPLYFVWEKVIGMHDTKSICLRALARLPVVIPIWFLAIIFPFFGPINSAVGALLVSFTVYIIPSLAHMLTYRKASARQVKRLKLNTPLSLFRLP